MYVVCTKTNCRLLWKKNINKLFSIIISCNVLEGRLKVWSSAEISDTIFTPFLALQMLFILQFLAFLCLFFVQFLTYVRYKSLLLLAVTSKRFWDRNNHEYRYFLKDCKFVIPIYFFLFLGKPIFNNSIRQKLS